MPRPERVLVTGATGFIGRHLVRRLEADGAVVTELVSPRTASRAGQLAVDVRDLGAVRTAVAAAEPEVVFHLAGTATRDALAGADGAEVNGRGTAAVIEAVHGGCPRARVVVASTDALTDRDPADAYERSKAAAEVAADVARSEWSVDVVVVRLANVYGPGDRSRERLVPGASAAAAGAFEPTDPAAVLDLVHVDDAVRGLVQVAQRSDAPVHRLASGGHVTVGAVVSFVNAIARGQAPPPMDVSPYETSVPFVPGWTPQIALVPGLAGTVRWYLERSAGGGAQ